MARHPLPTSCYEKKSTIREAGLVASARMLSLLRQITRIWDLVMILVVRRVLQLTKISPALAGMKDTSFVPQISPTTAWSVWNSSIRGLTTQAYSTTSTETALSWGLKIRPPSPSVEWRKRAQQPCSKQWRASNQTLCYRPKSNSK